MSNFCGKDVSVIAPTLGFNIETLEFRGWVGFWYTIVASPIDWFIDCWVGDLSFDCVIVIGWLIDWMDTSVVINDWIDWLIDWLIDKDIDSDWLVTASAFLFSSYKLTFWDVGGQRSLRSFWRNYFENTDALIWVVDSADRLRMEDCKKELHSLLLEEVNSSRIKDLLFFFCQLVVFCLFIHSNNSFFSFQRLAGATLVIFANKQDLPSAATSAQIAEVGIFFTSSRRLTIHINILSYVYQVRNMKRFGIFSGPAVSQRALCARIRSLSLAHSWNRAVRHNSLRFFHSTYVVSAVRNLTFANRILDGNIKWSTLSGTLMRHRAQAQASHAHMPQLFTVFPFKLCSAGGQKFEFCKSHFRGEYKVVHSFWNVKGWQSGVRHRHWPIFTLYSLLGTYFFTKMFIFDIFVQNRRCWNWRTSRRTTGWSCPVRQCPVKIFWKAWNGW